MVIQLERGQKLYIADEPEHVFEGALLEVDLSQGVARLDPLAQLTLDAQTRTWTRTPLPKGPARSARLAVVHDDENEARHYAFKKYASPLGDPGSWAHPSKRVWTLTVGGAAVPHVAGPECFPAHSDEQAIPSPHAEPAAPPDPASIPVGPSEATPAFG